MYNKLSLWRKKIHKEILPLKFNTTAAKYVFFFYIVLYLADNTM